MAEEKRVFNPVVLQTKQDLLMALKAGTLRTSKYNGLTQNQKLFVELVCFGDYSAESAIRVIDPHVYSPKMVANRMLADPNVRDCIDELTVAKDSKFKSEAFSARDAALAKLSYIMKTSKDEAIQLAAAKTILEKTNDYMKASAKNDKEDGVTSVEYHIQVDTMTVNAANPVREPGREPIIIPDDEQVYDEPTINPDTGLPYVLMYEGVSNYNEEEVVDERQNSDDDGEQDEREVGYGSDDRGAEEGVLLQDGTGDGLCSDAAHNDGDSGRTSQIDLDEKQNKIGGYSDAEK